MEERFDARLVFVYKHSGSCLVVFSVWIMLVSREALRHSSFDEVGNVVVSLWRFFMSLKLCVVPPILSNGSSRTKKVKLILILKFWAVAEVWVVVLRYLTRRINQVFLVSGLHEAKFWCEDGDMPIEVFSIFAMPNWLVPLTMWDHVVGAASEGSVMLK